MSSCLESPTVETLADNFLNCPSNSVSEEELLAMILAKVSKTPASLVTEKHDKITITYVGSTNNINTVVYSLDGVTVATLTMAYSGGVPVADNALLSSVTKS